MNRLAANIISADPMVTANLSFSRGLFGYPLVKGQIFTSVNMRCERCLDEVNIELNADIEVMLKPENEELPENEQIKGKDGPDFHEYDGKSLMLADLIEEELLLVLPLVPKHQDISLCNQDMVAWLAANEAPSQDQETSAGKAENPFAILKR